MTTITIEQDIPGLTRTKFASQTDFIEEICRSQGFIVSWNIPDAEVSAEDRKIIDENQNTDWESLDNL